MSNEQSHSTAPADLVKEILADQAGGCAIVIPALLDYLRATRRAKLAEVAALERFERTLTNLRASQPSKA